MTFEDLVEEAEYLARPCIHLSETGLGDAVSVWGGPGLGSLDDEVHRHCITVKFSAIPLDVGHRVGCLSVFVNEADRRTGQVLVNEAASIPADVEEGLLLYATERMSLPPVDAIFRFGSPRIREWLAGLDWPSEEPYNLNFPDRTAIDRYEHLFQEQCPLFTGKAAAVLGGWPFPWPDGDWFDLVSTQSLVIWTLRDAEPWVEVWINHNKKFDVIQRIT